MSKNKVLIPIDNTEFSERVLSVVQRFLRPDDSELILFHVEAVPEAVHIHQNGLDIDVSVDEVAASQAVDLKAKLLPSAKVLEEEGFTVSREVGFGEPAEAIRNYAKYKGIDLVAMATHGRTGVNRLLKGSVAEDVLRHLSIPLLLFHPSDA